MSERTVGLDFTPYEARQIAALLDICSAIVEGLSAAPSPDVVEEYRDRFYAGIAIAEAEDILRGRA